MYCTRGLETFCKGFKMIGLVLAGIFAFFGLIFSFRDFVHIGLPLFLVAVGLLIVVIILQCMEKFFNEAANHIETLESKVSRLEKIIEKNNSTDATATNSINMVHTDAV